MSQWDSWEEHYLAHGKTGQPMKRRHMRLCKPLIAWITYFRDLNQFMHLLQQESILFFCPVSFLSQLTETCFVQSPQVGYRTVTIRVFPDTNEGASNVLADILTRWSKGYISTAV